MDIDDTIRPKSDSSEDLTLKRLQEELALLTSYSTDTIYRLRYDTMSYDYISPAVEQLLGYRADEMMQMNIRSLILETRIVKPSMQTVSSFDPLEKERLQGNVNKWQADYLMRRKDGSKVWISDVSYPWSENGAIIGSVGSLRDITERVQAEHEANQEVGHTSPNDPLTELCKRAAFFSKLEEELKRLRRSQESLSVLLIDMDYFKNINSNYGEEIGDRVLKAVADILRKCLRETDTGSRTDGGQFAAILPNTPSSGAYWVAERIRSSVAKETFNLGDENHLFGCTVSIGVSTAHADDAIDAASLFETAAQRLYIAKHTGRNQVSIDELIELH